LHWGDGLPRAIGDDGTELGRRTPTILDLAWASSLFWDGRAESLEEQALGPIQAPKEMNLPLAEMELRLSNVSEYVTRFRVAYPGEPMTAATVAKALATFERTIISGEAPFDRWVAGDERAVSDDVKRGFRLFNGKANCAACHSGWRLTDDSFHDIGAAGSDSGRALIVRDVPGLEFSFKTPTLRNVAGRHPYMHDGSERTLADVIDLYNRGGRVRRVSVSDEIHPLHLTALERRLLGLFLASLTSRDATVRPPILPH
jgi:cytochrome c peroxidase